MPKVDNWCRLGSAGDFPYFLSSVGDKSICQSDMLHPYIKQDLNTTFNIGYRYRPGNFRMGFAWIDDSGKTILPPNMAHLPKKARLTIHINDSVFPENSHLIWQGTLRQLMHDSTSQLELEPLETGEYILMQKLATGETLIWHSEPKTK